MADLALKLTAETAELKKGLAQANKNITDHSKKVEATNKKIVSSYKAVGASIMAAFSIQAVKAFLSSSLEAYDKQAKNETKLLVALNGRVDIQERLIKQAQQLQSKTLFGDEEIISAQAFGASLGLTEEQIRTVIPVAMDLASVMDMSLESAVKNIGKTFSGMRGELGELIPALSSLTAEELKAGKAVELLTQNFGGQAEAAALVGTGFMGSFKNVLGDVNEQIGESLIILTGLDEKIRTLSTTLSTLDLVKLASDFNLWKTENAELYQLLKVYLDPIGEYNKLILNGAGNVIKKTKAKRDLKNAEVEYFDVLKHGVGAEEKLAQEQIEAEERLKKEQAQLIKTTEALVKYNLAKDTQGKIEALQKSIEGEGKIQFEWLEKRIAANREWNALVYESMILQDEQIDGEEKIFALADEVRANEEKKAAAILEQNKLLQDSYYNLGQSIMHSLLMGSESWEEYGSSALRTAREVISANAAIVISEAIVSGMSSAVAAGPVGLILIPALVGLAIGAVNTALNQIPGFAEGGIVGGNSYYGDKVPAFVNSGEMILTKNQQASLFTMLNGGGGNRSWETAHVRIGFDELDIAMKKVNKINQYR